MCHSTYTVCTAFASIFIVAGATLFVHHHRVSQAALTAICTAQILAIAVVVITAIATAHQPKRTPPSDFPPENDDEPQLPPIIYSRGQQYRCLPSNGPTGIGRPHDNSHHYRPAPARRNTRSASRAAATPAPAPGRASAAPAASPGTRRQATTFARIHRILADRRAIAANAVRQAERDVAQARAAVARHYANVPSAQAANADRRPTAATAATDQQPAPPPRRSRGDSINNTSTAAIDRIVANARPEDFPLHLPAGLNTIHPGPTVVYNGLRSSSSTRDRPLPTAVHSILADNRRRRRASFAAPPTATEEDQAPPPYSTTDRRNSLLASP